MLAKVFRIDVTKCQHCIGDMAILAAITNRSEVALLPQVPRQSTKPLLEHHREIKRGLLSLAL
jgi:hypothetical protein